MRRKVLLSLKYIYKKEGIIFNNKIYRRNNRTSDITCYK